MLMIIALAQGIAIGISQLIYRESSARYYQENKPPVMDQARKIKNSRKHFMLDGTVHQLVYDDEYNRDNSKRKIKIYDAEDKMIWQGIVKDVPYNYISFEAIQNFWDDLARPGFFHNEDMHRLLTVQPEMSRSIEFAIREDKKIKYVWRYLLNKQYFIAYDAKGDITGYLGASGFARNRIEVVPLGPFEAYTAWTPENSRDLVMLWQTDKKIYKLDFKQQTTELIFKSEVDITSITLKNYRFTREIDPDKINYRPVILCTTKDNTRHLIMKEPDRTITFKPPADWLLDEQGVDLVATQDKIYLKRSYSGPPFPHEKRFDEKLVEEWLEKRRKEPINRWVELFSIAENSQLDLINRYDWTVPPYNWEPAYGYEYFEKVKSSICIFSPVSYRMIIKNLWKIWPEFYGYKNDSILVASREVMGILSPRKYIGPIIISIILIFVALWHGWSRRTNQLVLILWLAVIALFGVAGFLTYWALNHTTVIKCSSCNKKRHLKMEKCVHCGTEFPKPESQPTDLIFT
jgi:hypothetical protein